MKSKAPSGRPEPVHRMTRRTWLRHLSAAAAGGLLTPLSPLAQLQRSHGLGICSISFRLRWPDVDRGGAPLEQVLQFIDRSHELGAGGVQTSVPVTDGFAGQIRSQVEAHGMFVEAQIGLPHTDADLDHFEAQVRAAKEAGASVARTACLSGRRYETFRSPQDFAEFARRSEESIRRAEPIARKHRLRLAIENHKDWRVPDLLRLLNGISSEYIGVCVDTGNSIALLEDPMAVVEAYAPYAFATHLKDMAVKESDQGFLLSEVPLGEGFLDIPLMVQTLRRARPELQFSLEMIMRDPLPVPCLAKTYWGTFPDLPAWFLAGTLSMVRAHPPRQPLPHVTGVSHDDQVLAEEEAVRKSLDFARKRLDL